METSSLAAVVLALFLAINIGGNNSAAEMGPAFGSGIRTKKEALWLIVIFSVLGAWLAGGHVMHTVGSSIVPGDVLKAHTYIPLVIYSSAISMIGLANFVKIPIATSHVMVCSIVGVGLFFEELNVNKVIEIISWWIFTPLLSFLASYLVARYFHPMIKESWTAYADSSPRGFRALVTAAGCFISFSAGSSSLAKAVGPVVGAGLLSSEAASLLGGGAMALGAYLIGSGLLHTVGKQLTPLTPIHATLIELISSSIIIIASFAGIPISLAEVVTCAVLGFTVVNHGVRDSLKNQKIRWILFLWPLSPFFTTFLSFCLLYSWHQS